MVDNLILGLLLSKLLIHTELLGWKILLSPTQHSLRGGKKIKRRFHPKMKARMT